jgi:hypothetical protein
VRITQKEACRIDDIRKSQEKRLLIKIIKSYQTTIRKREHKNKIVILADPLKKNTIRQIIIN